MWIISFIPQIHLYLAFYDEIISLRRFLSLPILCSQQQKKYNIINEDVITHKMKQIRVMLQMTQFHCEFSPFIGFVVLVYIGANPKIYFPRPNNIDIAWPIWLITNDIPLWTLHNFKFIKMDTKMSSFWKKN